PQRDAMKRALEKFVPTTAHLSLSKDWKTLPAVDDDACSRLDCRFHAAQRRFLPNASRDEENVIGAKLGIHILAAQAAPRRTFAPRPLAVRAIMTDQRVFAAGGPGLPPRHRQRLKGGIVLEIRQRNPA